MAAYAQRALCKILYIYPMLGSTHHGAEAQPKSRPSSQTSGSPLSHDRSAPVEPFRDPQVQACTGYPPRANRAKIPWLAARPATVLVSVLRPGSPPTSTSTKHLISSVCPHTPRELYLAITKRRAVYSGS